MDVDMMAFKRALKTLVFRLRLYAPLLPISKAMNHFTYLTWALAYCREQLDTTIDDEGKASLACDDRYQMYSLVLRRHALSAAIDYLEFGVYRGASIRWWAKNNHDASSRFFGFDTFTGLPEQWGSLKEGTYTANGQLPDLADARARFIKGLFQDTLPGFLETYTARKMVVHIDADLYTSTLYVLTRLAPYLKCGDIIIFDEFLAWKYPDHEFRALRDFASSYRVKYRIVGAADHFSHAAVEIL